MSPTRRLLVLCVAWMLPPLIDSPAGAGITFSDGGTHAINTTPEPDITLTGGTTLQVQDGAAIAGAAGANGITGTNSSVVLSGGSITGGAENPSTGATTNGIQLQGGSFTATGGTGTGGAGTGDGGDALDLLAAPATISGGLFNGGSGFSQGYGLFFSDAGPGSLLSISNGTFTGHTAASLTLDVGTATISGGSFQGSAGAIGAGLSNGAQLNISGGSFTGSISTTVTGNGGGSLNFFGTGLTFTPQFSSASFETGTLTGTLSGGQMIAEKVSFFSANGYRVVTTPNSEVSFQALSVVPEPASILMMGAGLAIVGLARRRRPNNRLPDGR